MPIPRIEDIRDSHPRHGSGSRLWAEWCFFRVCFRHFRLRFLLMAIILLTGAVLFRWLEPEKNHSLAKATYYTFSLIFGEPPEDFPKSRVLQSLFFIVPILGLTVIIEGVIDFALIVRDRRKFERTWCKMLAESFHNHIVLVGLGRLGVRTFMTLRRLGAAVVVIERDPDNQFLDEVRRDGSPLLIGDARREALLVDANIAGARSIVLATNDDMANLEAALDARKINADIRVVLRMFDQNMADKVRDGFNIHLAMSQSAISAPTFATCAMAPATVNSFIVGDTVVAMQRWIVREGGPLCGQTIAEIMRNQRVTIVEHHRPTQDPTICPNPDTLLEAGDGLMVQGPLSTLERRRQQTMHGVKPDTNERATNV
jgi:Trk K+ transport system NAD-binding subunit